MLARLPNWLRYALLGLLVAMVIAGGILLIVFGRGGWMTIVGWVLIGLLVAVAAILAFTVLPPLIRLYRFQKYFKQHEAQLHALPSLMQTGRTQEALMRFESVMGQAPDTAYFIYMRAFFLQAAGKLPEALSAANKALTMADKDPFLQPILQQMGGQMGQPTTVAGFKEQLTQLRDSLEPRVKQMRDRREKAAEKRKKKSR